MRCFARKESSQSCREYRNEGLVMDDAMRTSTFGLEPSQPVGAGTPSRLDKVSSECNII